LKEVHVTGFSPMEQQIALIRAVMQRASNLQTIVLKDYQPCDDFPLFLAAVLIVEPLLSSAG